MWNEMLDAVTVLFTLAAASMLCILANKFGAKISAKRFILIVAGLLLIFVACKF